MMADRFLDAPDCDTEPFIFVTPEGEPITIDSITQETICIRVGDQDAMLPLGHTYRFQQKVVYRDWPQGETAFAAIEDIMSAQ
jgi:hypothetical protein